MKRLFGLVLLPLLVACGDEVATDRVVTPDDPTRAATHEPLSVPTPTSQCAELATGEEPRLRKNNGPGTYRVGKYRLVIPEGMELTAYGRAVTFGILVNGDAYQYEVWAFHYQIAPGGIQVVVEREQRWNLDGELFYTFVTGELVDASRDIPAFGWPLLRVPGAISQS